MKVLIGSMTHESNMFAPVLTKKEDFNYLYGEDVIDDLACRDIFEEAGIEVIPTLVANGGSSGYVERAAYDHILGQFLDGVRKHKDELDGIFLFLHGAMHVADLEPDSGEHYLLERIREIVGPELPIGVAMDPHGNVSKHYCELANVVRCYRNSPHTDADETNRKTARVFIDMLKKGVKVHPAWERVSILIGGERCVSFEEPLCLINEKLNECEKDPRIASCSYHVGFAWADSPLCSACVVVVPAEEKYADYAAEKAKELADYAFSKRRDFHFTGNAMDMNEAMDVAYASDKKPIFISDAGDNTTAGALGWNTVVLRQILARDTKGKKSLIAAINHPTALEKLKDLEIGAAVDLALGMDYDEDSKATPIKGIVKAKGDMLGFDGDAEGQVVTVSVGDLDVAVSNSSASFTHLRQFEGAGLDWKDYDIIVIKQGYLFPELKEVAGYMIMSLTPGATDQHTENFDYKLIHRPMYPVDDV